jgi:hypothetical protein
LYRYLPAEIVGTAAALVAAVTATGEGVASAVVAATWAESLGFYAFVTGRELRGALGPRWTPTALVCTVRGVVAEFGVAEAADTIFVRPALMYAFVDPFGGVLPGVIAGKLAADLVFYGLAVPAYELRERGRA